MNLEQLISREVWFKSILPKIFIACAPISFSFIPDVIPTWIKGVFTLIWVLVLCWQFPKARFTTLVFASTIGLAWIVGQFMVPLGIISLLIGIVGIALAKWEYIRNIPGVSETKVDSYFVSASRFWWVCPMVVIVIMFIQPLRIVFTKNWVYYPPGSQVKQVEGETHLIRTRLDGKRRVAEAAEGVLARWLGDIPDTTVLTGIDRAQYGFWSREVGTWYIPRLGFVPKSVGYRIESDMTCNDIQPNQIALLEIRYEEDGGSTPISIECPKS